MTTNKPEEAMTDRGLLELAAKAARYALTKGSSGYREFLCKGGVEWNPLTNDGDALRLAVRLNLLGAHSDEHAIGVAGMIDADPYAATRRAIVRAAAEIGRTMP